MVRTGSRLGTKFLLDALKDPLDLLSGLIEGARRIDHVIGMGSFLVDGHLGSDAIEGLLPSEPVSLHESIHLEVWWAIGDDQLIEQMREPNLQDECAIDDDDALRIDRLEMTKPSPDGLHNPRMDDGIQAMALLGVGEDEFGQLRSIDRPIRRQDVRTELSDEFVIGWPAWSNDFSRHLIGIDDMTPQLPQDGENVTFARGDPPCESNLQHLPLRPVLMVSRSGEPR